MLYFKACTKCRGDLSLENDAYGDFLKCMQCGTFIDVEVGAHGHRSLLNEPVLPVLSDAGAQAPSEVEAETAVAA